MNIKVLKEMINNQPDDAEVHFFLASIPNNPNKIIFKVGECVSMVDLEV